MKLPLLGISALLFLLGPVLAETPARLQVSENRRYLVTEKGAPFFYLADTAWELFHRLDREETDHYLSTRAAQGFNVIQAVALAEMDGLNVPNAYGHVPLRQRDPATPEVTDGPQNDYWDHVDFVIDRANEKGLTIGLLPTWGDKWNLKWGVGPVVFNPENARIYGEWLGKRYAGKSIIWILGGDRAIESEAHLKIIRAMAEGLRAGDGSRHLMTFHPTGGQGSAQHFHQDPWLDFNMRQNGHGIDFNSRYSKTASDYRLDPPKPILDGEPAYEDIPENFAADKNGFVLAAEVRRTFYWNVFSGAFGHAYGHNAVWQMASLKFPGSHFPLMTWRDGLEAPGGSQMRHGKNLMLSRPFLSRIPDDSILVPSASLPGTGTKRYAATRCSDGSYAMIYVPSGRKFTVDLSKLSGTEIAAWWFDPRTGSSEKIGQFLKTGRREFVPPSPGELLDWVLVLDDASRNFPPPGTPAN